MKFAVQSGGKEVLHFQLSPSGQNKIIWLALVNLISLSQFNLLKFKSVTILASSPNTFPEKSMIDAWWSPQLNHQAGPFSSKMAPELLSR